MTNPDFQKLIYHSPHTIIIDGIELFVEDGVFSPDEKLTHSTMMLINNLPDVQGKTVLDMGSGTGVISILCSKNGARHIDAVDLNNSAILNIKKNVESLGIKNIEVIESDLYENIPGTFDYIFANLPISDVLWDSKEKSLSIIERFLKESKNHLNENGKLFLVWFSISDVKNIKELLHAWGYSYNLISEEKFDYTWYLFECSI